MSIPDCITFLVTKLIDLLSSAPIFPFVGIWVASFVLYLLFSILKRRA